MARWLAKGAWHRSIASLPAALLTALVYALHQDFFNRPFDAPLTKRMAPLEQAVQAVLIGHAANVSMANGSKKVNVQGLLTESAKA